MRKLDLMAGVARSMPDETGADESAETADSNGKKRKTVSKREYLLADGQVADKIEEAAGARYTLLGGADGNIDFDEMFANEAFKTMCAIFGFHTKVGNVANTVLNDKSDPGTPDDAAEAIRDFIASGYDGTWAERTGGVGVKIDKEALAGAIVAAYAAATPPKVVDYAKARELLEEPKNVRQFRGVPEIAAEYNRRVGRAPKTLDEMAAELG